MKFKKLVSLLIIVVFTLSVTIPVSAYDKNTSPDAVSNYTLLEQEEVKSALISAADDEINAGLSDKERNSTTLIGLGSGRDLFKGPFIEVLVTGISDGLINIEMELTVYHVPENGVGYFTTDKVYFYGGGLYNNPQRFYFNDWSTAGIQGIAKYSNGQQLVVPFTMIVRD